ncbi:MAG: hypothetical protein AAB575_04475 [Patescibacteria group bacterium]
MKNKRDLSAQKRAAAQFKFDQTNSPANTGEELDENEGSGEEEVDEDESFDPADDGASAAPASADSDSVATSAEEDGNEDEGAPFDATQGDKTKEADNNDRTTGDIEHEKALAGRMDRQKAIDEQFKAGQEGKTDGGKPSDQQKEGDKNAADSGSKANGQDTDQAKARALNQEKRADSVNNQEPKKPAPTAQKAGGEQAPAGVGMMHNIMRLMKKGFSVTGCIGTIFRLILDYLGAFYVYVFLDSLIKEDNTDRVFTGAYCLTMLAQLLILLSPILIAVALASAAGYILNGLVDMNTILNFIK